MSAAISAALPALCLMIGIIPTRGMRELLVPAYPANAIFGESMVSSWLPVAFTTNPALAACESYTSVYTGHTEWFAGTRKEQLDLLLPYTWGTVGVGVDGFHLWNLEYREVPSDAPELFHAYTASIDISYARSFPKLKGFSLGMRIGGVYQTIYQYSAAGVLADLGAAYRLEDFLFGISLNDLGPGLTLSTEKVPLPSRVNAGLSWQPLPNLGTQIGACYEFGGGLNVSAGISTTVFEILSLELGGGYGARPHAGAGLSLNVKSVRICYAASFIPVAGLTHHVGAQIIIPPRQKEDPNVRKAIETSRTFTEIGKRDMINRDYRHALDQFDIALTWWPDNEEAQKGYNEALQKERERQVSVHLEAARNYAEAGEFLDALREYEFVLSMAPDNALALSGRADMQLEVQEMPIFAKGNVPEGATQLFSSGVDAFRKEDFSQALAYWQEVEQRYQEIAEEIKPYTQLAMERRNQQVDSLILAAYNARERDALRQSADITEIVLKIDPTNNRAHTLREELVSLIHRRVTELLEDALGYFDAKLYDQAAESFNKILTLDPANATAKRYLDRMEQEEKLTRKTLEQLNITATTAYALGDYDTAIRIWEQIVSIDSTFTNVQRNLERARQKKVLLGP